MVCNRRREKKQNKFKINLPIWIFELTIIIKNYFSYLMKKRERKEQWMIEISNFRILNLILKLKMVLVKFSNLYNWNHITLKYKKKEIKIELFKKPQIQEIILKWSNKLKIRRIKYLGFHRQVPSYQVVTRVFLSLLLIKVTNSLSLIKPIQATVKRIQAWFTFLMCKILKQNKLIKSHLISILWELHLVLKLYKISDRNKMLIKFCLLQNYPRIICQNILDLIWIYKRNVI